MINVLAVSNYRSIRELVVPLTQLNLITGANGSGKTNLYRALRLLSETAQDGLIAPLAREGGLASAMWAGPNDSTITGGKHRLRLGFAGEDFGYAVTLGMAPKDALSAFKLDPQFKREAIWQGPFLRPASLLVDRNGALVRRRSGRKWDILSQHLPYSDSLFTEVARDQGSPEVFATRQIIRDWRFYDHFRVDADAPARQPQLGTRTTVLHPDGRDLAAALQTIREIGDAEGLEAAVEDAFPGSQLHIDAIPGGLFGLGLKQNGLLRTLFAAELSDGTLRYLLLIAALLSPRPPTLMILNEPEASLHADLLPALGRLIIGASAHCQIWVVSHSARLCATLEREGDCNTIMLERESSETVITGQSKFDRPPWHWPD